MKAHQVVDLDMRRQYGASGTNLAQVVASAPPRVFSEARPGCGVYSDCHVMRLRLGATEGRITGASREHNGALFKC